MLADVRQAAAGEWIPDSEALHIGADGTELQVMMSLCPVVTPGGGITGLSVLVRDIRERVSAARQRVSLHAQLEQTKKLESLGILAGGIAHDFNALLTGILGNTALATADLPVSSPVRARLEEIEQATHRAAHLCAQMLAYSGRGRFIVQPLDLSGFVRRATRLLEAAVPQKCVVEYQLADGLPPAEADESQLRQVLMNLVTNAAEAIGQRTGFLVVHTGLCTADRDYLDHAILGGQRQEGEYVFLEVADTGCGMDDETRRCAFDPFFSTKLTGRGLGLAAVLGIVRGHGGAIHLDTQPDAGTRIRVLLPAVRAPAHKEGAERPWSDEGTLLVAGRDRLESLMARTVLTQAGFTVLAASSADEAVRLLGVHGGGISAALVDIGDADEDALRLPVRLREVRRDLPIVVVATVSEARARDRAGVPDPVLYIRRPASREKLIGAFRDVLGREEPG
jgi:signal transduction histidine kinase/CheY-like chemotaxis protein